VRHSPQENQRFKVQQPKLIETLVGELLCSVDETAEIVMYEDGKDVFYHIPVKHFNKHNIADGDEFFFEVYDNGTGKIAPKILYGPWPEIKQLDASDYPTREELEAQDDEW